MNDGQIIAWIVASTGSIASIAAIVQTRFAKRMDRAGAMETRQTAIEANLLSQLSGCAVRITALEKERNDLTVAIQKERSDMAVAIQKERSEMQAEVRLMETRFRTEVDRLEAAIDTLKQINIDLQHQNWLYAHGAMGVTERKPSGEITLPDSWIEHKSLRKPEDG